jgi:hypothetical protein
MEAGGAPAAADGIAGLGQAWVAQHCPFPTDLRVMDVLRKNPCLKLTMVMPAGVVSSFGVSPWHCP